MSEDPKEQRVNSHYKGQPQYAPWLGSEMKTRPAPVYVFDALQESSCVCGVVIGVAGGEPLP